METSGGVPGLDLAARGTAEIRALAEWAERIGWLDAGYYLTLAREGGLEHRLWLDEASGRVIKLTLPGFCGRTIRLAYPAPEKREIHRFVRFGPATPLEYLDRLALHNALFGDDVRVLGVASDRVAAFDAHTANFVRTRGEAVPFDVITFHANAAMARVLTSFV